MAAIVSGVSLGLTNSSAGVLGAQGKLGTAPQGGSGERVYVNAASGNLVLQRQDEVLLGTGVDISLLRTYNSQGLLNDDNGDNWRLGVYKRIYNLTGTVNAAGSTVTRVEADGAESVYVYDAASGKYLNSDGGGAQDRLSQVTVDLSPDDNAVTDGNTYVTRYTYDGTSRRVATLTQSDGTSLAFTYIQVGADWRVATLTDALGRITS